MIRQESKLGCAWVPALYGTFVVRGVISSFSVPFFCSTRAASILPSRPQIPWPSRAGAVKDGAIAPPEGRVRDRPEHGGTLAAIGRCAIRGEPAMAAQPGADHTCIRWIWSDPDHEAGIRFASKAPRRRVHSDLGT